MIPCICMRRYIGVQYKNSMHFYIVSLTLVLLNVMKMYLQTSCVLMAFLLSDMVTNGQVLTPGKCPVVEPMTDFKIQPFLGVWYEVFRFYDQFEEGQSCIRMEYTLKSNGHIGLQNCGDLQDNTTVMAEGDGYVSDPSIPARFNVMFTGSKVLLDYTIVATDYTDHALVFSCTEVLEMANVQFAWILSRNRTIDNKVMRRLVAKLSCYGVDVDNFENSPQFNC